MNVPNTVLETGWNLHHQSLYHVPLARAALDPGKGKFLLIAARKVGAAEIALGALTPLILHSLPVQGPFCLPLFVCHSK
jgi:hypothetical protein